MHHVEGDKTLIFGWKVRQGSGYQSPSKVRFIRRLCPRISCCMDKISRVPRGEGMRYSVGEVF